MSVSPALINSFVSSHVGRYAVSGAAVRPNLQPFQYLILNTDANIPIVVIS